MLLSLQNKRGFKGFFYNYYKILRIIELPPNTLFINKENKQKHDALKLGTSVGIYSSISNWDKTMK